MLIPQKKKCLKFDKKAINEKLNNIKWRHRLRKQMLHSRVIYDVDQKNNEMFYFLLIDLITTN